MSEEELHGIWLFLNNPNNRNSWFKLRYVDVYMRNSRRDINGSPTFIPHIDIADITVVPHMRHVGVWTALREGIEKFAYRLDRPVYIENVLNRTLRESLLRHGYKEAHESSAEVLCFRKILNARK